MRKRDPGRIDTGTVGEREQKNLVAKHMLEHGGEKVRLTRGGADRVWRNAGDGKKVSHAFRLFGNKGKRLNCQHFRRFPR